MRKYAYRHPTRRTSCTRKYSLNYIVKTIFVLFVYDTHSFGFVRIAGKTNGFFLYQTPTRRTSCTRRTPGTTCSTWGARSCTRRTSACSVCPTMSVIKLSVIFLLKCIVASNHQKLLVFIRRDLESR